jgi:hypothetical protein
MQRPAIFLFALLVAGNLMAAGAAKPAPKILLRVAPLPTALNGEFQFRKTKLFELTVAELKVKKSLSQAVARDPNHNPTGGIAVAPLSFERSYRMYGAITNADRNQRYGNYFDFFWRVKRPAHVTVRLEYRQEKLRSFVQAREIAYDYTKGTQKTEFAIIGDDYLNDGRVIAWRCLLIEDGRIVAENRSFLWE